jgi:hypothetical protein
MWVAKIYNKDDKHVGTANFHSKDELEDFMDLHAGSEYRFKIEWKNIN